MTGTPTAASGAGVTLAKEKRVRDPHRLQTGVSQALFKCLDVRYNIRKFGQGAVLTDLNRGVRGYFRTEKYSIG